MDFEHEMIRLIAKMGRKTRSISHSSQMATLFALWSELLPEMHGEVFARLDIYSGQALALTCWKHWRTFGTSLVCLYPLSNFTLRAHPGHLRRDWAKKQAKWGHRIPPKALSEWFAGLARRGDFSLVHEFFDFFRANTAANAAYDSSIFAGCLQGNPFDCSIVEYLERVMTCHERRRHSPIFSTVASNISNIVAGYKAFGGKPSLDLLQRCLCHVANFSVTVSAVESACWIYETPDFFVKCVNEWQWFAEHAKVTWAEAIYERLSRTLFVFSVDHENVSHLSHLLAYFTAIWPSLRHSSPTLLTDIFKPGLFRIADKTAVLMIQQALDQCQD
jgi:hypothetical protein